MPVNFPMEVGCLGFGESGDLCPEVKCATGMTDLHALLTAKYSIT